MKAYLAAYNGNAFGVNLRAETHEEREILGRIASNGAKVNFVSWGGDSVLEIQLTDLALIEVPI